MSPGHPPLSQPDPSLQAYAWKVWDRIAVIGNEALRRSAPLFYEPTPGKLSFLASSVVLGVGEARFLVTAGHALDEFLGKPLYAGGETELVALGGKWVHSRMPPEGRDRDHIDLAVFRLDEATIRQLGLECVSPADTDPAYQPDPRAGIGTYYICVGFPKARQSTWIKDGMLKPPKQLYNGLKDLGEPVEHALNVLHIPGPFTLASRLTLFEGLGLIPADLVQECTLGIVVIVRGNDLRLGKLDGRNDALVRTPGMAMKQDPTALDLGDT